MSAVRDSRDLRDPFGIVGFAIDGKYWVEKVVGAGGFGVVYRARHLQFDSPVALKVLRLASDDAASEELSSPVLDEGRLLFTLGPLHPSIVRVYDVGTLPGASPRARYLALEWLDGVTLAAENSARRLQQGRLSLEQALDLMDDVAQGLAVAHSKGIAHRDIKPANIFLTAQNGRVSPKILDFGVAKVASSGELGGAFADSHFGPCTFTPAYGAPEQWRRRLGATGTWTDVHALALVCVELIAGRHPFSASDPAEWVANCLDEKVRATPRVLGIEISDAVEAVFERALALDPRSRFADVGTFLGSSSDRSGVGAA